MKTEEKKNLKLGQKLAFGSGDMACNFCYTFVTSFALIYLTDSVGLNAGIIGTLMMVSRIFDGVTDVLAGTIIDRTKSKMGKARPWMLYTILPLAICEVLLFSTPSMAQTLQYAYFFIVYTLLNCTFYTMHNIAYMTLSMLITGNKGERVQLGTFRFSFTIVAGTIIASLTMTLVDNFGGGAAGWRMTAIIYSVVFVIISLICVLSLKELPASELGLGGEEQQEKTKLLSNIRYLLKNKYYLLQVASSMLYNTLMSIAGTVGIYYMTYKLDKPELLGVFSLAMMFPMVFGLALTPMLVKRLGMYKANLAGLILATIASIPFLFFGLQGDVVPMLIFYAVRWFGCGPQIGTTSALTAEVCGYTMRREGVRLEGTMFSCNSMGTKVGAGIGTAVTGWLLAASHYDGLATVQPESAINMISFMYAVLPLIIMAVVTFIFYLLNVEKSNEDWDKAHSTSNIGN